MLGSWLVLLQSIFQNRSLPLLTLHMKSYCKFDIGNKINRLKDCDEATRLSLAYICKATQLTLQQGLAILGIDAPERMEKQQ